MPLSLTIVVVAVCISLAAQPAGAQGSKFTGTWVLNQDQSTFQPLENRPERRIVTLDVGSRELTHTTETQRRVTTQVEPFEEISTSRVSYKAGIDGREHPVPNSSAKITLKRVDASTFERTASTGRARETATWSVSADGRVLTVKTEGLDEYGMTYSSAQVYDRQ